LRWVATAEQTTKPLREYGRAVPCRRAAHGLEFTQPLAGLLKPLRQ
jgi:hypothetical protein